MNYRYKLQESLEDSGDDYVLKTNQELKNIIIDFGCGETEFHTADIERLIKEHEKMRDIILELATELKARNVKNKAIEEGIFAHAIYK